MVVRNYGKINNCLTRLYIHAWLRKSKSLKRAGRQWHALIDTIAQGEPA